MEIVTEVIKFSMDCNILMIAGSARNRHCNYRSSYQMYQNSNIPYQTQFSPPQKKFFYPPAPLYSNIRPLSSKAQGPYVTQVTIRDNHHHYTSNSLGTKV